MKRQRQWRVLLLRSAQRELLGLRGPTQKRVREALSTLAEDPQPADSIAMHGRGSGLHRLRVGQHRIIYRIQESRVTVLIIRLGHRSEVYRGYEGQT